MIMLQYLIISVNDNITIEFYLSTKYAIENQTDTVLKAFYRTEIEPEL